MPRVSDSWTATHHLQVLSLFAIISRGNDTYIHTLTEVFLTLTEVFTLTEDFFTLTEDFPCFFLSCKANARV